jgi:exopolysaccharide biosynthesis protein
MRVKDFVSMENAIAGVNASYFKPDTGTPLGVSIIDGEILTGPLYNRVVFGITPYNSFKMDKIKLQGNIKIGKNLILNLININQPQLSKYGFSVFTDRWGFRTPVTKQHFCHIVVEENKISYIKQSSVQIPRGGYVLVGPHSKIKGLVNKNDYVTYNVKFSPYKWCEVKYAIGGGPYLVRDGSIFIDKQHFTKSFLWTKEPRTAIGFTKSGCLILVTIDGRRKGYSEGASLSELAKIMWELGSYNAMNLDGGSSTQMVYKGKLVNTPLIKGGGRVTNALLVVPK